jgi:enoyl-CoA hydratase
MSETAVVTISVEDRIMIVTVNRPDKLNALNRDVIAALTDAIRQAGAREDVGVVVLTGAGNKAFVAGADIAEMSAMSPLQARRFAREGQALGGACDLIGKPVIAAVEGFALGGGCELAAACHLRVAGPRARFGQPEVNLGLIPGFGGTQRLARIVGEGRALELILTGSMIDAETALSWGLVNRIAEGPALDASRVLAAEILEKGPVAVGLAIDAVRNGASMPLEQALEYEASLFSVAFSTEDRAEGTSAFLAKRSPGFRGR